MTSRILIVSGLALALTRTGKAETTVSNRSYCSAFATETMGPEQIRELPRRLTAVLVSVYVDETGTMISSEFINWQSTINPEDDLPLLFHGQEFIASTYHPSGNPLSWWMPLFHLKYATRSIADIKNILTYLQGEVAETSESFFISSATRSDGSVFGINTVALPTEGPWDFDFVAGDFFENTAYTFDVISPEENKTFQIILKCE